MYFVEEDVIWWNPLVLWRWYSSKVIHEWWEYIFKCINHTGSKLWKSDQVSILEKRQKLVLCFSPYQNILCCHLHFKLLSGLFKGKQVWLHTIAKSHHMYYLERSHVSIECRLIYLFRTGAICSCPDSSNKNRGLLNRPHNNKTPHR